ncbi:MAG: hypothetical protein AW09_000482 [Candidatus Accumulibacter phosphatis]|uniref:Uncharacterized protein n=1 Tax=Candidatus Accumulibacter phosphatis TaxID=327160 RepID=A0A080M1R4_9PROT|nr:MAG: hypothetical protein AW09_000482 [Candidatus Accumulibacter phosphatis]
MDLLAESSLDAGVFIQPDASPGLGDGAKTLLIGGQQPLELFGGLPGLLIHRRQRGHLCTQDLQVLVNIVGEMLMSQDQKVFFCIACGRHLDLDFESQRFTDFEDGLQLPMVSKHRLQGLVVVPDDADEQQADDSEAEPDLLADPEFAPNLFHILLLAGESCRFSGDGWGYTGSFARAVYRRRQRAARRRVKKYI